MIPLVLAHGALGAFDELLFLAVAVVFVALMVTAWIRSRNSALDEDEDATRDSSASTPASGCSLRLAVRSFPAGLR